MPTSTRKAVGAECRHDMQPSVQLSAVSDVDSKLGRTTVRPSLQSAPELPAHPPALLNEATVALTKKLEPSQARKLQMSQQLTV